MYVRSGVDIFVWYECCICRWMSLDSLLWRRFGGVGAQMFGHLGDKLSDDAPRMEFIFVIVLT